MTITRENIYRLISGNLGINIKDFKPNASLRDIYKADSLASVEIIMVLDEHLDIDITLPDDYLKTMSSAKVIADYILERYTDA